MTILEALKAVSAHDDDHATVWNHVGFSGQDTHFANKLAAQDSLSPKQEIYAARMVRKYRKQVFAYLASDGEKALKGKARESAIDAFLCALTWQHPTLDFTKEVMLPAKAAGKVSASTISTARGILRGFVVRFKYSPVLVDLVKRLPNRTFTKDNNDPRWTVGCTTADIEASDRLPLWTLTERVTGPEAKIVVPRRILQPGEFAPLGTSFCAQHLHNRFAVGDKKYFLMIFNIRAALFNGIVKYNGGKPLGPNHGFIVDLHLENKPMTPNPVLHRERWYPTEEKANAAVKELYDFLNTMTIGELMNLNLPDFHQPRAGANG